MQLQSTSALAASRLMLAQQLNHTFNHTLANLCVCVLQDFTSERGCSAEFQTVSIFPKGRPCVLYLHSGEGTVLMTAAINNCLAASERSLTASGMSPGR